MKMKQIKIFTLHRYSTMLWFSPVVVRPHPYVDAPAVQCVNESEMIPLVAYPEILNVLQYDEYSDVAEYLDRERGIFKLHKPDEVAELWKCVKGRNSDNNMTYDKLARALRYYYGNGIMHPSPGRFTFRFGSKSGFSTSRRTVFLKKT
ncbi:unnamed protein product [Rotaria magnacalcarata]|uniref:ETS domain-containing protein n=1 Tax=Rotaria magnacalcarata TaxID=392030 RepID=A0A816FT89_9BILA|nr:unnamed protein product [Rotaria magnacalcarata]